MDDSIHPPLDRVDLRILDLVQREGALSVAEVASRTGLSTTTCWRRIQHLEQTGVIRGRVALLDRAALGLDVTIFAHVKLSTQGRDAISAFAYAIRERPEVLDCYTTMGEWDFMLRVVTRDGRRPSRSPCTAVLVLPFRTRSLRGRCTRKPDIADPAKVSTSWREPSREPGHD